MLLLAAGVAGYVIGEGGGGSDTTKIAAVGTAAAPQTTGTIVRSGDAGVLRVDNLPQRRGRIYEVWLVQGRQAACPPRSSRWVATARARRGFRTGSTRPTQVMVTSEPAGGSDQPTTQPLLSARV